MSSFSVLLAAVHQNGHHLTLKRAFSDPQIYTGGVNIAHWGKLSKKAQEEALKKPWYVYYKFLDPKTGRLKRQSNIKAGANFFKNKKQRLAHLKAIQKSLLVLLEFGFNPYEDNSERKIAFRAGREPIEEKKEAKKAESLPAQSSLPTESISQTTVNEAVRFVLNLKKNTLAANSYRNYQSRIKRFQEYLKDENLDNGPIQHVNKKVVNNYLNKVLEASSARNRNNTRTDLSSFFQTLVDNEMVNNNIVTAIRVYKTKPVKNKTYTPDMLEKIESYLKESDPLLLLFVQFISYPFLRPVEVCRLKIGDLDLKDKKLRVKTKTKHSKIKIIPDILLQELPDLSAEDPNHLLFTQDKIGGEWPVDENQRRDYFSKRFKKVKKHFDLGTEYGLYSFRHTYITRLYQNLCKEHTSHGAKERLLPITGHQTMIALDKYLRDIDAVLPDDYSHLYE